MARSRSKTPGRRKNSTTSSSTAKKKKNKKGRRLSSRSMGRKKAKNEGGKMNGDDDGSGGGGGAVVAPDGLLAAPWTLTPEECLNAAGVDMAQGLSTDEATELRGRYGLNELEKEEGRTLWELFVEQFDDLLVKILLAAAGVSFGLAFFEREVRYTHT